MRPVDVWILCASATSPLVSDVELCRNVMQSDNKDSAFAALAAARRPIAVELASASEHREFLLPTARHPSRLSLRELSFGEAR